MRNEDIIKKELENLGCKFLDDAKDGILTFLDDTWRIYVKVYLFKEGTISFHVFLTGGEVYKTILVSGDKIPFSDRKYMLSKIENILNKNRQLVSQFKHYKNALSFIRDELWDTDEIFDEFVSHFSQFGTVKDYCVVVDGYFGEMSVSLDSSLQLKVGIDVKTSLIFGNVYAVALNNSNYNAEFEKVDDLIREFKEKSPDSDFRNVKGKCLTCLNKS